METAEKTRLCETIKGHIVSRNSPLRNGELRKSSLCGSQPARGDLQLQRTERREVEPRPTFFPRCN